MDCVFVKARKISKSLKGNRGSAVNYSKYLDRTLKGVDYADKGKLLASGIDGTDEKPIEFWKKAEARELQTKRKDTARFAKEYIVGLPHNLPIEVMKNISETISKELSKNARVVSWYLHEPDRDDESNGFNFHSHFLMSEREYKNGKFAEIKNREWNTKATLQNHKKIIGGFINERLVELGLPQIKIEMKEEKVVGINKTENQIKAERKNRKNLRKADRKIKLAEVKLNGLGRTERQFKDVLGGNSKSDSGLEKQYADFQRIERAYTDFQQAEQIREDEKRKFEEQRRRDEKERNERLQRMEQQRKLETERTERERKERSKRNEKSNGYGCGFSR